VALAAVAAAGDKPPSQWRAEGELEETWTDNLSSNPAPNRDADWFSTFTVSGNYERPKRRYTLANVGGFVRGLVFARFPEFNYAVLETHAVVRLDQTHLFGSYRFTPERLLFDNEDDGGSGVFYREQVLRVGPTRRFGADREWDVRLLGEAEWRDFQPPNGDRTSFTPAVLADLRYLRTPRFMPRLGLEYGVRNARADNYSRDSFKCSIGAQSLLPWWDLTARGRFRYTWHDYTAPGPVSVNSNAGRDDNVYTVELWLGLPIAPVPGLLVSMRYSYQDGLSSDPDHVFTRNEVSLGIAYGYAGIAWPW
jgi:hypothetical protein